MPRASIKKILRIFENQIGTCRRAPYVLRVMAKQQSDLWNYVVFAITLAWLYVWETIENREHIFARTQFLHVGVVVVACLFLTLTVPMYLRYSKPLLRNSVADYILPPDALEWRKQLTQIIYDKAYASNALVSLWIFLVVNIWISFIPRSWWSYGIKSLELSHLLRHRLILLCERVSAQAALNKLTLVVADQLKHALLLCVKHRLLDVDGIP